MTASDISAWFRGPLLEAVLIVLGALLLSRAANAFASLVSRRRQPVLELPEELRYRRAIERAIARTVIGLMWFVAIVLVVSRLDLPITALVAPATVLGAALGFGAQKLVGDFLSGFFLLAERQLSYGDVVEISPPGTSQWMKGWDGTFRGKKQSVGAYVWVIKGTDRNGKKIEMKGTVMLVQ